MKADGGETMPWWIWLLLALFMLAMVVSGVVYACLHGYRAFKDVAKLGERTAKRIEAMGKPLPQNNENEAPFFTRMPMPESLRGMKRSEAVMLNSGHNGVIVTIDPTILRNHDPSSSP